MLYGYGGPVTIMYTWILVCAFNTVVGLSMAEICSAYPTSGGVYFYAYKLAGKAATCPAPCNPALVRVPACKMHDPRLVPFFETQHGVMCRQEVAEACMLDHWLVQPAWTNCLHSRCSIHCCPAGGRFCAAGNWDSIGRRQDIHTEHAADHLRGRPDAHGSPQHRCR